MEIGWLDTEYLCRSRLGLRGRSRRRRVRVARLELGSVRGNRRSHYQTLLDLLAR